MHDYPQHLVVTTTREQILLSVTEEDEMHALQFDEQETQDAAWSWMH